MIELFADLISESSRACVIFCRLFHLDVEVRLVSLRKGEHRTPELCRANPLGRLPFLLDDGFGVPEGCAVLTYLARRNAVSDHWYPVDLQQKTAVDSALHWQHRTLRHSTDRLLAERVVRQACTLVTTPPGPGGGSTAGGTGGTHNGGSGGGGGGGGGAAPALGHARYEAEAAEAQKAVMDALGQLDKVWLGHTPFMTGSVLSSGWVLIVLQAKALLRTSLSSTAPGAQICLADLLCACIVEQLRMLDTVKEKPDFVDCLKPFPKIQPWVERVAAAVKPHFDDVHSALRLAVGRASIVVSQQRQDRAAAPLVPPLVAPLTAKGEGGPASSSSSAQTSVGGDPRALLRVPSFGGAGGGTGDRGGGGGGGGAAPAAFPPRGGLAGGSGGGAGGGMGGGGGGVNLWPQTLLMSGFGDGSVRPVMALSTTRTPGGALVGAGGGGGMQRSQPASTIR